MEDIQEQQERSADVMVELDRLREENLILTRQIAERDDLVKQLEETAAGRESDITCLRESAETMERETAGLLSTLNEAVSAYRELILRTSPELPNDLVIGTTIAEIDAGAERARELVTQVRQELEADNARQRVPAGAPPRTTPDVSGLSAREKIRFALETKSD